MPASTQLTRHPQNSVGVKTTAINECSEVTGADVQCHSEAMFRAGQSGIKSSPPALAHQAHTATAESTMSDPPLRITVHEVGSHAPAHVGCRAQFHGSRERVTVASHVSLLGPRSVTPHW